MNPESQVARDESGWFEEGETWLARLRAAGPAPTVRGGDLAGGSLDRDVVPGYLLLREIGRGGQGVVYAALQVSTRREVAIKLLREGPLATRSARQRFAREIELVASLDHSSIVRVLEAGETTEGRPFVAMELVDGKPLSSHAAGKELSIKERLALTCELCDAIENAHRHGVIHLDLKPANVLVGSAGIKVLDFGLARSSDEQDLSASLSKGLAAGTPAYMAPEQVEEPRSQWDRRVDVHAIGLLLFELISGRLPHELKGGALQRMEIIAHSRPMRLSTACERSGRILSTPMTRDLDAILAMALAKNPDERYATAEALGTDLRAVLNSGVVQARQDEHGYRARHFVRDHLVTALVLLTTVIGLASVAYFFFDLSQSESRQRQLAETNALRANTAEAVAEKRLRDVRSLSNTFIRDLDALIRFLPGAARARRRIVSEALAQLEEMRKEAKDDPLLAVEVAEGYITIGDVLYDTNASHLGEPERSIESHTAACAVLESVDDLPRVVATRARAWLRRAAVEQDLGRAEESRNSLDKAEELARSVEREPGGRHELARILSRRARWERDNGDAQRADELEHDVHAAYTALANEYPDDLGLRRDYAAGFMTFASASRLRGELPAALDWCARFRKETEALLLLDVHSTYLLADLALADEWSGRLLADSGDPAAALEPLRLAIVSLEGLLARDPGALNRRMNLVSILNRIGEAHAALGKLDAAHDSFQRFLEAAKALQSEHPEVSRAHRLVAVAHYKQSELALARVEIATDASQALESLRVAEAALAQCVEYFEAMDTNGILQESDADVPNALASELQLLRLRIQEAR